MAIYVIQKWRPWADQPELVCAYTDEIDAKIKVNILNSGEGCGQEINKTEYDYVEVESFNEDVPSSE